MRKTMLFLILLLAMFLAACSNGELGEADAKACDMYSETVEASDNGTISDEEMLQELEDAWNVAEDEQLQDSLDDLLIYFEDGQGDLQDSVNNIKTICSLD